MVQSVTRHHRERAQVAVVLNDETLTLIDTIIVTNYDAITIYVSNSGNALDQFEIAGNAIRDGTFEILFNAAVDFTSPAGILIGASGDLTTLADGASGWVLLYPKGFFAIRIQAARATGADTTLTQNSGGS